MVNIFVKNSTNDTFMMERFNPYSIIPRLTKHHLSSGSNTFSSLKYGFYFTYSCNVSDISSISFDGYDTSNIVDMSLMFYHLPLAKLDLNNFDTRNVSNFYGMFCGCRYLRELDLSSFDISKVEDMCGMFLGCERLTKLDVSHFVLNKARNMANMFKGCLSLHHIKCPKSFMEICMTHSKIVGLSPIVAKNCVWDIID